MRERTIHNCSVIELPKITTAEGNITFYENNKLFPFPVKRCFYLFDVPAGGRRGGHAHIELHQVIIAVSGSFEVILDDGSDIRTIHLNQPDKGLLVPSGIWKEVFNFSAGSNCLVLASEKFFEKDYIRNLEQFYRYKRR